ncbi:hypothetical protein EV182_001301, partial [Spiromyces aspiralis]
ESEKARAEHGKASQQRLAAYEPSQRDRLDEQRQIDKLRDSGEIVEALEASLADVNAKRWRQLSTQMNKTELRIQKLEREIETKERRLIAAQRGIGVIAQRVNEKQRRIEAFERAIVKKAKGQEEYFRDTYGAVIARRKQLGTVLQQSKAILARETCAFVGVCLDPSLIMAESMGQTWSRQLFGQVWPVMDRWNAPPFAIRKKGATLIIRPGWREWMVCDVPLSYTEQSLPDFIIGLAMLLYNLAYVTSINNVQVPAIAATDPIRQIREIVWSLERPAALDPLQMPQTSVSITTNATTSLTGSLQFPPQESRSVATTRPLVSSLLDSTYYDVVKSVIDLYTLNNGPVDEAGLRAQVRQRLKQMHICDEDVENSEHEDEYWDFI